MAYNRKVTLDRLDDKGVKDAAEQKVFFRLADGEEVEITETTLMKNNGLTYAELVVLKGDEFRLTKKGKDLVCGRVGR